MVKKLILTVAVLTRLFSTQEAGAPTQSAFQTRFFPKPNLENITSNAFGEEYARKQKEFEERVKEYRDLENYRTSDFNKDSEELLLARLILGEAENCGTLEKIAVAYTAINRTKRDNETLKEVILKPHQYSCFNPDTNSNIFLKDPLKRNKKEFLKCLSLAKEILKGQYKDPTNGATFYFNPSSVKEPSWTRNLKKIGRIGKSYHVFYKEKN